MDKVERVEIDRRMEKPLMGSFQAISTHLSVEALDMVRRNVCRDSYCTGGQTCEGLCNVARQEYNTVFNVLWAKYTQKN
jgi:hypothetical protein